MSEPYRLDDQVGFLLRLASQRHGAIFQTHMTNGLTPTQFAVLMRLAEVGPVSQNHLGRLTGLDVATAKGVVDRLRAKDLVTASPDPNDGRLRIIELSATGRALIPELTALGRAITEATLQPLGADERTAVAKLLRKLG
ncbi:MAG: MarR family transcriptional regulator [Pseudomonadota bacterium]